MTDASPGSSWRGLGASLWPYMMAGRAIEKRANSDPEGQLRGE